MNLIDGKKIASELRNELKVEVDGIKKKFNKVPGLTVILIGDLAPSQIYVRNKEKSAKEIGLKSEIIKYPKDIQEIIVLNKIDELNIALKRITERTLEKTEFKVRSQTIIESLRLKIKDFQ